MSRFPFLVPLMSFFEGLLKGFHKGSRGVQGLLGSPVVPFCTLFFFGFLFEPKQ